MVLSAYGAPTATFAIMQTRTCSLIFYGPGFNENNVTKVGEGEQEVDEESERWE